MAKIIYLSICVIALTLLSNITFKELPPTNSVPPVTKITNTQSSPTPSPSPIIFPESYEIPLRTHTFQRFNNCGPASLSMALSYFDIYISQIDLGNQLRPYQILSGDNDDKSVTLEELQAKAEELGLLAYHRPSGNIEIIKKFISQDIPVVTRTLTKTTEDIGHFRLVRGYYKDSIIQDDSLQGKGLVYSNSEFLELWKQFNYEYLVIFPKEKEVVVTKILGEDINVKSAWTKAAENSKSQISKNPNDSISHFNLSVALYNLGDFEGSISEFEKVESLLTFRTLWYQIDPILAYYEIGNYQRVFDLTNNILENGNRAFSELYIIRGDIYRKQGNIEAAKEEYEKAVFYNQNLEIAKKRLSETN